jgi:ABC-2 type transport system ATP-binding protein
MISALHLSKSFNTAQAVRDVSLQVEPGQIYGLVGPDGAGKTTTIRMLCGALRPDQGSVSIAGLSMERQPEQCRAQIGYLSQRFSLYEDLTVQENLRFFAEVRGLPQSDWQARSQEILDFVDLGNFRSRLAGQLSGGMKQKLGLAIALVTRPRVLLLDEPTTGVDPLTRQEFWQLILRLTGEGQAAILVSTPYMDEATRCTRIGFMRGGQLAAEGTPRELRGRLEGRVLEVTGAPLAALLPALSAVNGVLSVQRFGERVHLTIAPGQTRQVQHALGPAARQAGARLSQVEIVPALLEDVFIAMSGEAAQ